MLKNYMVIDENRIVTNIIVFDDDENDPVEWGVIEAPPFAAIGDQLDENNNVIPKFEQVFNNLSEEQVLTLEQINQLLANT